MTSFIQAVINLEIREVLDPSATTKVIKNASGTKSPKKNVLQVKESYVECLHTNCNVGQSVRSIELLVLFVCGDYQTFCKLIHYFLSSQSWSTSQA